MSDAPTVEPLPIVSRLLRSRRLMVDLATSYLVSIVRAGSMFAIIALLSRRTLDGYLAAFLFIRSMLGILTNTFAGAQASAVAALRDRSTPLAEAEVAPTIDEKGDVESASIPRLAYESKVPVARKHYRTKGFDGLFIAATGTALIAYGIVKLFTPFLESSGARMLPEPRPSVISVFALSFAIGSLGRLGSDAAGGVLQSRKLLALDNLLVLGAELLWVSIFAEQTRYTSWSNTLIAVGSAYAISGSLLFIVRWLIAGFLLADFRRFTFSIRFDVAGRFLAFSGLLALASMGDFLYGPANNLIITKYLDPILIADYGPALQIDALLLLGVAALASVIFPRAVALHESGDRAALRRAYLIANYSATALLTTGAAIILLFRDSLLHLWLGNVRPGTAAILPFVLGHTVLGGNAGIGRAVLLGMGRFRAYTVSALLGGLVNLTLALLFVLVLGWGLRSIVIATVVAVTLRCAIWMPWYVLRTLREPMAEPRSRKGAKTDANEFA